MLLCFSLEPSTSRSTLNFTDILTRPSLHRSHLSCNILDSPPPLCQPSTSSAFPISNSGLSLGKEMKDSTSQHDDDNISTTSGFSSRASDKGNKFHQKSQDMYNSPHVAMLAIPHNKLHVLMQGRVNISCPSPDVPLTLLLKYLYVKMQHICV